MIFSALRHAFQNMSDSEIHSTLSRSVCHRPGRGGDHDWKGHLSVRKHKSLRSALIECAWQAVQNDPAMLLKYEQLRKRMTKKRAVVVIARKLLSRIYYVLKNQQPYELGLIK